MQYDRYIEPFGGSGAVLLGKETPDKFEVYNDYNKNLVNLFRCMRERPMAFIKELGFLTLNARDDFTVIKDFFKKEEFNDRFLSEEMELTKERQLSEEQIRSFANVVVFISHEHIDHLDPIVFTWKDLTNVIYIVSSDMPVGTRGKRMAPGDTFSSLR